MRQFVQFRLQLFHVGIVGDIHQRLGVGNQPTVFLQIWQVAQRLHRLEGDNEVCRPERDKVGCNRLVRKTEVRLHVASALTHPVDFRLFHVEAFAERSLADNGRDREDSLSSYARKDNICFHFLLALFFLVSVWIHSRRGMRTETPLYSNSSRMICFISS